MINVNWTVRSRHAERITMDVINEYYRKGELTSQPLHAVFCPTCRIHYTTMVPHQSGYTGRFYICGACGGNGLPSPEPVR